MAGNIHDLGELTIRQETEEPYEGETTGKKYYEGKVIPFHVTGKDIDFRLGYVIFTNDERDIRVLDIKREYEKYKRLEHGLRLTVNPAPGYIDCFFVELKLAYPSIRLPGRETLHRTISEKDLADGSKLSAFDELQRVGAIVGTKRRLIGDLGKTSKYLCARFPKENLWVPVVAYTLTRLLPISWGYPGPPSL